MRLWRTSYDKPLLRTLLAFNLTILLPIIFRKPPIKDWIIVYLFNAVTNVYTDKFLTYYKFVRYPVRIFSKVFDTHVLFDLLIYPTITVLYNQLTYKKKPLETFYKLFYFTIPLLLIELWAERKTTLIQWNKKRWKWYHTFLSVTFQSLITRLFIGMIRKMDRN